MIEYVHKTHPRARSLKIKVEANGQVVVVTPARFSQSHLEAFLLQNQAWIERAQAKAKSRKSAAVDENQVSVFGKVYQLVIEYSADHPIGVRIEGATLIVNPTNPAVKLPGHASVKAALERFLKNTAEKYLVPRTHQLAKHMKISFTTITLRQQKTRWGSCSSTGSLNFNWRLVHYAPEVIDYVIIHELAHRKHMDHSLAFWNVVKTYDPEFMKHRGWLKRHGMSVG